MQFAELAARVRLLKDSEPRQAQCAMAVGFGSIDLECRSEDAESIGLSVGLLAFGKQAEKLLQCRAGDLIAVSGDLQAHVFEGMTRLQIKCSSVVAARAHFADADSVQQLERMQQQLEQIRAEL